MTQAITVKEVKANAAKAYDDGLLLAQAVPSTSYGYAQICSDGVKRFCAIGASLSEETHRHIKANGLDSVSLGSLVNDKLRRRISWKKRQDKKLSRIQYTHDHWMKMVKRSNPEVTKLLADPTNFVAIAEDEFLKAIGHKRAAV